MKNDLTQYLKHREMMQTGDVLSFQSHSIIGSAIRWWTKSDVNHTGMVIRFPTYELGCDRIFVIEAMGKRLEMNSLSERLEKFKGQTWWLSLKEEFNPIRNVIGGRALYYVGTEVMYDYKGCILGNLFGRAKKDKSKLFCSEAFWLFVEEAAERAPFYCEDAVRDIIRGANEYLKNEVPTPGDIKSLGIHRNRVRVL